MNQLSESNLRMTGAQRPDHAVVMRLGGIMEDLTTDELLENLPSNLHLARNDNAPVYDRWRIYNSHTKKYVEPGFPTARELMIYTLNVLEKKRREWIDA